MEYLWTSYGPCLSGLLTKWRFLRLDAIRLYYSSLLTILDTKSPLDGVIGFWSNCGRESDTIVPERYMAAPAEIPPNCIATRSTRNSDQSPADRPVKTSAHTTPIP